MSDMKLRRVFSLLIMILILLPLSAQEAPVKDSVIRFASDYTRASLHEDEKSLLLSGNAWIETGSTMIQAAAIEIFGKESRYISCTGDVEITDSNQGLTVNAKNLYFDRQRALLRIDGWAEMEDRTNEIIAKAAYLENSQETGITLLQISVKIYKHTEDGPMICMTDSAIYDSEKQTLQMTGNSIVYWKGSSYEASQISVDLTSNQITLEGRVKGTINE